METDHDVINQNKSPNLLKEKTQGIQKWTRLETSFEKHTQILTF